MILSFISDQDLFKATKKVVDAIVVARNRQESELFRNVVDPFSGLFDAAVQNINIEEWLDQERSRQIQKTFQNAIGSFHQEIIGSMPGWENLGTGNVVDISNKGKKVIAEIKNKFNTTKGNHRVSVYDDLKSALSLDHYQGFTAYCVEILPKNKKNYDTFFIPPDNRTHKRRPKNKKIRLISGQLFYDLASGEKNALKKLYLALPQVIEDITGISQKEITGDMDPAYLFDKAY